jgi:hypothetical protein
MEDCCFKRSAETEESTPPERARRTLIACGIYSDEINESLIKPKSLFTISF